MALTPKGPPPSVLPSRSTPVREKEYGLGPQFPITLSGRRLRWRPPTWRTRLDCFDDVTTSTMVRHDLHRPREVHWTGRLGASPSHTSIGAGRAPSRQRRSAQPLENETLIPETSYNLIWCPRILSLKVIRLVGLRLFLLVIIRGLRRCTGCFPLLWSSRFRSPW